MGTFRLLPENDEVNTSGTQEDAVGKTSVPLFLILRCHEFSNTPSVRANGGAKLHEFILPFPESAPTALNISYNEELAKEQGIVAKLFTETGNLGSNLLNLPGRIIGDQFQSLSGVDLGRRPMDVTELSLNKAEKRRYSFNWVFTSISFEQSAEMVKICNLLTSFSLPSTAGTGGFGGSTRMIMPPMWTIEVSTGSNGTYSNNSFAKSAFLQNPKTCFLTNVSVDRDTSALMNMPGNYKLPTSFALSIGLTEIDPLLRKDGGVIGELQSRSEIRAAQGSIL